MKINDEIKIKGKNIDIINDRSERVQEAKALIDYGAEKLKQSRDHLFDLVNELYPELDDYNYSINHETNRIKIVGLKIKTDK